MRTCSLLSFMTLFFLLSFSSCRIDGPEKNIYLNENEAAKILQDHLRLKGDVLYLNISKGDAERKGVDPAYYDKVINNDLSKSNKLLKEIHKIMKESGDTLYFFFPEERIDFLPDDINIKPESSGEDTMILPPPSLSSSMVNYR